MTTFGCNIVIGNNQVFRSVEFDDEVRLKPGCCCRHSIRSLPFLTSVIDEE